MELDDEELVATKKYYGIRPTEKEEALALLEHWKNVYNIPLYEIDKVRYYIQKINLKLRN